MSRPEGQVRARTVVAGLAIALIQAFSGPTRAGDATVPAVSRVVLNGKVLEVTWDEITNAPLTVSAVDSELLKVRGIGGLGRGEVQDIGTLLIARYSPLLKVRPENLVLKKAEKVADTWYLSYRQTVRGIGVYDSSLGFSIEPDGRVKSLGAVLYPDVPALPVAKIGREQALRIARIRLRDTEESDHEISAESVAIYPERRAGAVDYRRVYIFNFFARKGTHPASVSNGRAVFVDSRTGEVVKSLPLYKPLGCCLPKDWTPPETAH